MLLLLLAPLSVSSPVCSDQCTAIARVCRLPLARRFLRSSRAATRPRDGYCRTWCEHKIDHFLIHRLQSILSVSLDFPIAPSPCFSPSALLHVPSFHARVSMTIVGSLCSSSGGPPALRCAAVCSRTSSAATGGVQCTALCIG